MSRLKILRKKRVEEKLFNRINWEIYESRLMGFIRDLLVLCDFLDEYFFAQISDYVFFWLCVCFVIVNGACDD